MYIDDFEVTPEFLAQTSAKKRRVTVPVKADFRAYVSAWQLTWTIEGEGLSVYALVTGTTYDLTYMNAMEQDITFTPGLNADLNTGKAIAAVLLEQGYYYEEGMDPEEDDPLCYGNPKWLGEYPDYLQMTFQFEPNFTGATVSLLSEPSSTPDPRGPLCVPNSEYTLITNVTVEQPAENPAPAPTFDWNENEYIMEAVCADHEVVLMINGEEVDNPYAVLQTYEEQTITFTAYTVANSDETANSAEVEMTVTVPAKAKTPSNKPSIVVTPGDDAYTIEATGTGTVELYVNGEKVDNPYVINRPAYGEADITVTAKASNLDSDPDGEIQYEIAWSAEQDVLVPAKDPEYYQTPDPVITVTDDPDNQRVIIKVTGEGTVTMKVTKTADDPGMEGEIVYQGEDNEGQIIYYIPYGDVETYYSVYATACAEGEFVYPADATEPFVVVPAKPAAPEVTATPTVTIDGYTVTATGDGTVYLYVDDEVVATGEGTATYTINPDDYPEGAELGVTARAQEQGKEMSDWAPAQVVYVDAKLNGALNFSEVDQETGRFSVSYNGEEDVTITLNDESIELVRGTSNTYQLPAYGTYPVTATATAEGYRPITKDATLVWNKPAVEEPDAPQITIDTTPAAIIVGASNVEGATVVLYQCEDAEGTNGVEIANPTAFPRLDTPYTVWVYATATNDAGEATSTVTEVVIPAKPVDPETGIDEMTAGKTIANVRYFNMAGQEMQEANGMTIIVTTYTDGTTSAVKVMK